jgi:hypothetical protein
MIEISKEAKRGSTIIKISFWENGTHWCVYCSRSPIAHILRSLSRSMRTKPLLCIWDRGRLTDSEIGDNGYLNERD